MKNKSFYEYALIFGNYYGTLRDPVSRNILLFERILPGQGTDGTSYTVGDLHTIEYEDGYFDYEETEELNNILDREFTEL